MKKASSIIYLIAFIFNVIGGVSMVILGICGAAHALPDLKILAELVKIYPEITYDVLRGLYIAYIFIGVFCFVQAALFMVGRNHNKYKPTSGAIHIVNMVLNIILLDVLGVLGGIFGLIGAKQQANISANNQE